MLEGWLLLFAMLSDQSLVPSPEGLRLAQLKELALALIVKELQELLAAGPVAFALVAQLAAPAKKLQELLAAGPVAAGSVACAGCPPG